MVFLLAGILSSGGLSSEMETVWLVASFLLFSAPPRLSFFGVVAICSPRSVDAASWT